MFPKTLLLRWNGRCSTLWRVLKRIEHQRYISHYLFLTKLNFLLSLSSFIWLLFYPAWIWYVRAIIMLVNSYASFLTVITFFSALMPFRRIKILPCTSFIDTFSRMKIALIIFYFIIKPTSQTLSFIQFIKKWSPKITLKC